MAPALFLIGDKGPRLFCPPSLNSIEDKDTFATLARLLCIVHNASAMVIVLEAWMKMAAPDKKLDLTEPPSEAFDRMEVVSLMGESQEGQQQKILKIVRSGNHNFFSLVDATPKLDSFDGRFAQILPAKLVTPEDRVMAEAMLGIKDIGKPGSANRLASRRRR